MGHPAPVLESNPGTRRHGPAPGRRLERCCWRTISACLVGPHGTPCDGRPSRRVLAPSKQPCGYSSPAVSLETPTPESIEHLLPVGQDALRRGAVRGPDDVRVGCRFTAASMTRMPRRHDRPCRSPSRIRPRFHPCQPVTSVCLRVPIPSGANERHTVFRNRNNGRSGPQSTHGGRCR